MDNERLGTNTSLITIIINSVLCIFKFLAAILGNSSAMLADAVHSLTDILTTTVVIIGLKVSSKEADDCHPYGHEKFEPVFAKIMSFILIFTGVTIGYKSAQSLINGDLYFPGRIALAAAVISIFVKEAMYWYTVIIAKKIKSLAMEADAWHHRSDALSSIGTAFGILGARLGIRVLDPLAGLFVSILIIKVGLDFYLKAVKELVDHSAGREVDERIKELASNVEGVTDVNSLKTRVFGNKIYADIQITVDADLTVKEGYMIAEKVHDTVEEEIVDIKHCSVQLEPGHNMSN